MHCITYCSYVLFKLSLDNNCFCSFFFLVAEKDKTTYISSTVAIILLIALVITCIRFVNIFFFYINVVGSILSGIM